MKISIVIPVFNGLNFLKYAINSVLQQTYQDFEIIIIDDASTEDINSFLIDNYITWLNNERILYFRNQTNQERCYSRNLGIDHATGEIITFLDHDDQFKEHHLLALKEAFEDKQTEMVYSVPEELIDYEGRIITTHNLPLVDHHDIFLFAISGSLCNIGMAFTKEAINRIGKFHPKIIQREDYELSCRAVIKYKLKIKIIKSNSIQIRRIKAPNYFDVNSSINPNHPYMEYSKITQQVIEKYILETKLSFKKYMPYCYIQSANTAITFHDYGYALRMLSKAWLTNPFLLNVFMLSTKLLIKTLSKITLQILFSK